MQSRGWLAEKRSTAVTDAPSSFLLVAQFVDRRLCEILLRAVEDVVAFLELIFG